MIFIAKIALLLVGAAGFAVGGEREGKGDSDPMFFVLGAVFLTIGGFLS